MIRVKKILYPTDFSSYSNQAYFHAVALAEEHGASLDRPLRLRSRRPGEGNDGPAATALLAKQLEQIRPANPTIAVNHVFLEGDPAREIVRYAADAGMDLIVMGTHGRTGLERLLMGSVAEKVMRRRGRSVLRLGRQVTEGHSRH